MSKSLGERSTSGHKKKIIIIIIITAGGQTGPCPLVAGQILGMAGNGCSMCRLHLRRIIRNHKGRRWGLRVKLSSIRLATQLLHISACGVETLGQINRSAVEFFGETCNRISLITGYKRETYFLLEKLSSCTQHFNFVAFKGTFTTIDDEA